ncbi:MAG: saccharopine dehydrogenase NADP-binding domain-containing protein [Actinomycetota bacterium]|nr:saccharopine dehydrogenase NADP-binding domain-containing protein [Actinomycetota bacterium]
MTPESGTRPSIERIAVLGLGNVGGLIADMLSERGFDVQGIDADGGRAADSRAVVLDVTDPEATADLFAGVDAVVSCLPYYLNAGVAAAADSAAIHYLDLTEDVPTSQVIRQLAKNGTSAFIPHCGLAPGFICMVGASLAATFDRVDRIALRVGALPRNPNTGLAYACNWSPAGVINEYLKPCEQLHDGEHVTIASLSELETIVIDGTRYEAFTTSGGLGTMYETFAGRVDRLDYKTVRYPGHCELMRFLLHELRLGTKPQLAQELLVAACPPVRDDLVVVYAAVEGAQDGGVRREQFVRTYRPREIGGAVRTAIAWTTAAGAVGMLELLTQGALPPSGLIRQEDVSLEAFLQTSAGRLLADECSNARSDETPVPIG